MNNTFLKIYCFLFFSFSTFLLKGSPVDSLNLLIKNTQNDSIISELYYEKALLYSANKQQFEYFSNLDKAIEHAKRAKSDELAIYFLYYKGVSYFNIGQYVKSIEIFKEYLKSGEDRKDFSQIARAYQKLALSYKYWGKYSKAIDYCQKSIDQYIKLADNNGLGQSYNIMCWIYEAWNDYVNAEKYGFIAYNLLKTLKANSALAYTQLAIANCKLHKDSFIIAYKWFNDAEKQFTGSLDNVGLAYVFRDKGKYYLEQKNFLKAEKYIDSSVLILERENNLRGLSEVYVLRGQLHALNKNFGNAIEYITKGLTIAKKIDLQEDIVKNLRILSETYAEAGDLKKALIYERLYSNTRDSVFSQIKFEQLSELRTRYETDKKENELLVQKSLIVKQSYLLAILGLLIILTLAFVFNLYKQYKQKKKSNKLLAQQKAEIDASNTKLKELDEAKSRFFSNISHEFRTPLTLIKGPAEQLSGELKDKHQLAASNLIVRNANRLQELINQLLDISRLERGSMKLRIQYSDILMFVRTRVSLFSSLANEKKINFNYVVSEEPQHSYFDADKLEKIIYNLISNAFKYTDERGSINVLFRIDRDRQKCILVVSDTGLGIPTEHLPFIFDRFFQVDTLKGHQNSSGIGLALVKELTELYQGKISVTSEIEKGSTFTVELPCSADAFSKDEIIKNDITIENCVQEISSSNSYSEPIEAESNSGPLLLVIEDNDDMRQYIVSNLYSSFRIIEACNGAEGLEFALKENPELILSDIMMPEMDGYQLTSAIKTNSQTSHIPIVLLTAKAAEESLLKGFENEADDYLTKPFSVKELRARVMNLIKVREKLKEKFSKSIVVNPSEVTTTSLDEQFLIAALKAVEKNIDNPAFTAEMLCSETGVSRANMHRKLKALTNQSATEFIRSIRLKRAAQLLSQKSGNISEISTMVGFNTLSYFTACFKEEFNCLPSEYIKN